MPVMYAAAGNCHVFVDASADLDDASRSRVNVKVQRPRVCNAAETLLVHADVARRVRAARAARAARARRGAARRRPHARAGRRRWPTRSPTRPRRTGTTEYHALILAVKVVDSVEEAIEHVNRYGSGHSEAIVTDSTDVGARRSRRGRRGLRLRQRVHALHRRRRSSAWAPRSATRPRSCTRAGRSALRELTTYKFVVEGSGQVRE